jgi:serine phosphatase RsbU (regulator of sigma subunit)
MQKNLPEHFVLFKPRDIVSGDFFWASKREDKIIITAADCTGHGVPGAFMSMLGISFLNKIVNERGVTDPGEILNQLRKNIIQALKQDEQSEDNSKDGMDISMTVIDLTKRKFYFSGAYNPLFIIKNKEAKTIEADRMPVAIYEHLTPFSVQEFDMGDADMIYMFSDGYPDQFGGNKGKKFMKTRFRNLLSEISDKDMKTQHDILDKTIEEWRGAEAQIDDIVVVGVKLI